MISYLKGLLISKNITTTGCKVVIEVNNIGYEVLINKKTYMDLPVLKSEITIYTSLLHKEDAMLLCGFLTPQERETFAVLQTVSGIGMKAALLILELPISEIISAVISENEKVICQIKGIGPKLAKRLILELKDKMMTLKNELEINVAENTSKNENFSDISQGFSEAQAVLNSLGYTCDEISLGLEAASKNVKDNNDTQEILQTALAVISGS
ncbi:MAG: Holliday junction branch migration protein RuvA [Candidatus Gastranaerophilales bacterium]|nr:Holliday junction branch migration protein RuvA [Candidatus Gastranaerophilales bacterium]